MAGEAGSTHADRTALDQGILIRCEFYDRIQGFPDWPLLEDVELLRRGRAEAFIRLLEAGIMTSARRFERRRIVRQQLFNMVILLRDLRGDDPRHLARTYAADLPADASALSDALYVMESLPEA